MTSDKPLSDGRRTGRTAALILALLCAMSAKGTNAGDLPAFRPGLWEFTRSMQDDSGMYRQTKFTRQRCADPMADMRKAVEKSSAQGCSLSPLDRSGDIYESTSVCSAPLSRMESHSVLTAAGDGAYRLVVTSRGDQGATTEEITARRLGDCPARSGGH